MSHDDLLVIESQLAQLTEQNSYLAELLEQNNQLLQQLNGVSLFVIGVSAAVFVCFILYKFLRLFY